MSTALRRNRKGSDRDICRLNSLGFSLAAIGKRLDCHPTSITLRLKGLGVTPADTRRAFMESVFHSLPADYQDEIADLLEKGSVDSIKAYVRDLIDRDISTRRSASRPAAVNVESLEGVKEQKEQEGQANVGFES